MSKISPSKVPVTDLSRFCPSVFTLTFVIEVVGIDVWHDCNEGWVELGPMVAGVKLSYQLYPGQTFDLDIVIWPHAAKIFYGNNCDWVRTWQFLQRRWLSFTIRHAFPVRVVEMRKFVATVSPQAGLGGLSSNSKSEKTTQVYLPPLRFRERRQFAQVVDSEFPLTKYIENLIWFRVVVYIPTSYMDGLFDTPYPVQDIRHQDAALYHVQDVILNRPLIQYEEVEEEPNKAKRLSKDKKRGLEVPKYEIKLSGDWILAGIGRVVPFVSRGERPAELGEVIALISSTNLPAYDDYPVFFVNVGNLPDIPMEHLIRNRFTHIYTRWTISEEEHNSEYQPINTKVPRTEINFNDHHSVPLSNAVASDIMAMFMEEPFRVEDFWRVLNSTPAGVTKDGGGGFELVKNPVFESRMLRGIRIPPPITGKPNFFGYAKGDRDYGIGMPPPIPNQDVDILIAQTRIDPRALTKINGFINGEFPLFPPEPSVVQLEREGICTNDINAVRAKVKPDLIIQPGVILEAQMSIEISMGLVGCKPWPLTKRYSRLYCLISDHDAIMTILRQIKEINESVLLTGNRESLLTGFGLDTGDTVMLYVEGPKEGHILQVWERAEDFHPTVKPVFSTSAKYIGRLYPELLLAAMPFNILKMFVPLSVLLGLTPIYTRPAIPLPTRSAVLKLGRLIAGKFPSVPCRRAMPTAMELKSFRLELCVAPRPPPIDASETPLSRPSDTSFPKGSSPKAVTTQDCDSREKKLPTVQSATRINWKPTK